VPLVSRPQSEKLFLTKACDAGVEITSCATSGTAARWGWQQASVASTRQQYSELEVVSLSYTGSCSFWHWLHCSMSCFLELAPLCTISCLKYVVCHNWIETNWSSWSFELQLVINDFISITIKFKLWISWPASGSGDQNSGWSYFYCTPTTLPKPPSRLGNGWTPSPDWSPLDALGDSSLMCPSQNNFLDPPLNLSIWNLPLCLLSLT